MFRFSKSSFLESPKKAFLYATQPYRFRIGFMYLCIIAGNACAYTVPYLLKLVADRVVGAPPGSLAISDFTSSLLTIVLVLFGQEAFYRVGHWLETTMVVRIYDRLTTAVYEMLLNRPAAYFEEKFSGELTRRVEQVGTTVKLIVEQFPWELGWPAVAAAMTTVLLSTAHPLLVTVFVAWLALFLGTSYPLLRWQYRQAQAVSEMQADLSGTIVDVLGNTPLVQAFGAQDYERAHYRKFMDRTVEAENLERKVVLYNKAQQGTSIVVLSISLIVTSIVLFTRGAITVGDFVIVAATLPTFTGIIWNLGEIVIRCTRSYGEMKNALESLRTEVQNVADGDRELVVKSAAVDFENISFSYPNNEEEVIQNLTLHIEAGEKLGLVGKSGAGKSTVVKLLLRSYDPESGTLSIGGTDVSTVSLRSLRHSIAFVPQDTALFHRTLYENILYAKPEATKQEVVKASMRAHAHNFIETFPSGYDTLVGERGVKLSGGQRQRIALARAILKNAPILVLDEATSALDSESEEIVQRGLQELFSDRTVLAIAHRLSTLRAMDRIVVMDNGRIVEDGAPEDLLKMKTGIFKAMWEHQKSGFI